MLTNVKYSLPDGFVEKQFIRELTEHYAIRKEPAISEGITFYDTFDWRLYNKSLVLYASENKLFLRKLAKSDFMHNLEITSQPVFIWDLPDSELKNKLAPIIKMRALLKLAEVQSRSTFYGILNQDKKIVTRLAFEKIRPSLKKDAPVLARHVWLNPVKGYPKYSRNLAEYFEKAGLSISKKDNIFIKALESEGKKPGSYSAKVNLKLDPDMRADKAAKVILNFLLSVIRINEANIEKDFDTEVVHDFRVAIRRTRSALGQIKYVFPTGITERFKKDFAFVGKLSNDLRDLDVYLLNEAAYKAMLPPVMRDDIDPLFDYLRKKRTQALHKFIRQSKSKKYTKILQDWETFLSEPRQDSTTALHAELPIFDLARKRIYKKYRSVVKAGNLILENTEDEMLHVLRIHCKKLRYLLEFFSSLFDPKKVSILIAQLKKLQDNLGDFNDLCIQEEYLLYISRELPVSPRQYNKTLLAIGSLIGTLNRERRIVKDGFAKIFKDFAAPENQNLFKELFAIIA
jgi:CHAD domain-containing protein